jgi:hypothetical protein
VPGSEKLLAPVFVSAMGMMGQDPGDPTHTWPELGFRWPHLARHEDFAGNTLHLLLIIGVLAIVLVHLRSRDNRRLLIYALGLVASFVLFCTLLRYTIWSTRYHLPIFALSAPLAAETLWRYAGRRAAVMVGFVLFVGSLVFLLGNKLRSLVPGDEANIFQRSHADMYFSDQHFDIAASTEAAARSLDGSLCRHIGILARLPAPESTLAFSPKAFFVYPLLALLNRTDPTRHIAYVGVSNVSAKYGESNASKPCAVVCLDCAGRDQIGQEFGLDRIQFFGDIAVLTAGTDPDCHGAPSRTYSRLECGGRAAPFWKDRVYSSHTLSLS